MLKLPENYTEKVYAGWLGKCIGVRFGAPIESWTYQQINNYLGEISDYLPIPEGKVFQPDDDIAVPLIFLKAVEDFGPDLSSQDIGRTLLNYLCDQHGSLWWGGYGISTEHTAYLNLKFGIFPPLTGSIKLNGASLAEQIGGQIFSDIWGLLTPNEPQKAANYAQKASSVTHDRNGIFGGMFVAAMVSAAFSRSDPADIIKSALSFIPSESEYARVVNEIISFHQKNPSDWRECCEFIHQNFGYERYSGMVPIIPNAAIIIMGLLYGTGDFSRSIQITNMGGWDTDCNVGNVGAVMGVAKGLEGIPMKWRTPQNDMLVAASLVGSDNIQDIPRVAKRIVNMGALIAGQEPSDAKDFRYDFKLPGATHGFKFQGPQRNILKIEQSKMGNEDVLKVIVRLLKKKQDMTLFVDTYFHPHQLNSDYYCAGFSPKIYPGQAMQARIFLPEDQPGTILASLFVHDSHKEKNLQGPAVQLKPGEWQRINWTIPRTQDACLSKAGLIFRNLGSDTWRGVFFLDYFDWGRRPGFDQVFKNLPMAYGAAEQWTYLRGYWRVDEQGYHGSGPEPNESYTGEPDWEDLDIQLQFTPILGELHGLGFRVQGAQRSYAALLLPEKLSLCKKIDGEFQELASTPFSWQLNTSIQLNCQVTGNTLHLNCNQATLTYKDELNPYLQGQIALVSGAGCHTSFEEIHVR